MTAHPDHDPRHTLVEMIENELIFWSGRLEERVGRRLAAQRIAEVCGKKLAAEGLGGYVEGFQDGMGFGDERSTSV